MASLNLGVHVGDIPANVTQNRALLRTHLPSEPVWMEQVHGAAVIDAASSPADPRADGAVTRKAGVVCCVMTADCLPVLLADEAGTAVGIAHAGWRGLAHGVIEATIGRMQAPPSRIVAYLGPAISRKAYEVGAELFELFVKKDAADEQSFIGKGGGKYWCDLYSLATRRLVRLGVSAIYGGTYCTHGDAARFFSFRRDGQTGRMASLIWLTQ
ncbi:MAG: peptidoglycan editing factor PgeF [Betaproteobacteria bacterium]|nr:peptidoglycan editing factor PgeF [Betaproteobacteria bacterium]